MELHAPVEWQGVSPGPRCAAQARSRGMSWREGSPQGVLSVSGELRDMETFPPGGLNSRL